MSAICGLFHREGSGLDRERLLAAMGGLSDFGYDGSRVWEGDSIGFGMQALHVTPESKTERLPRWVAEHDLAIVADARIDNRPELSDILDIPADAPDSEFLIAAYRKWEMDCPQHLIGDFAFAIWDQEKRRLFCARDFIGSRPLYFTESPERFLFASDTEGLFAAGVAAEPDFEFLAAHFRHGCNYPHPSRTCYAAVRALAPASAMTVDEKGIRWWEYWNPTDLPEVRFDREEEYVEALRELLERSVSDRLRCAFPIGAHFSGGLDSSTVAVVAHRQLQREGQGLQAGYSWSPPPEGEILDPKDERRRIQNLGECEQIPLEFSQVNGLDHFEYRFKTRDLKYTSDEPHEWATRRTASERGTRLLLSGWGGDEGIAFHGHGYLAELFGHGQWRTLGRVFREGRKEGRISGRGLIRDCLVPWTPAWLLRLICPGQLPAAYWPKSFFPKLFLPEFARELRTAGPLPDRRIRGRPGVKRHQEMLFTSQHLTRRMEAWAAAGGRSGLAYAYPLADRRLVEFSLGLPPEMYFRRGWGRYLFRKASEAWLPKELVWSANKSEPSLAAHREYLDGYSLYSPPAVHGALLELPVSWRALDVAAARKANEEMERTGMVRPGFGVGFALLLEWQLNREMRTAGQAVFRDVQGNSKTRG